VEIEVRGDPLEMGYCHCENCRRYSAAPVSAFTLWKKENVSVTKGEEFLGRFKSSDISERGYCTKCGGHIIVEHPTLSLIDVRIGALPNFPFKPRGTSTTPKRCCRSKTGFPNSKTSQPPSVDRVRLCSSNESNLLTKAKRYLNHQTFLQKIFPQRSVA
jgi:hypothetical protein